MYCRAVSKINYFNIIHLDNKLKNTNTLLRNLLNFCRVNIFKIEKVVFR
jgi:hypothetical protein